jgi:hypothetical protein
MGIVPPSGVYELRLIANGDPAQAPVWTARLTFKQVKPAPRGVSCKERTQSKNG